MILLASGSALIDRYGCEPWFGQLLCPRSRNRIECDRWAADNAAFSKFDGAAYLSMVERIVTERTRPIFVTVPDVVADAHATRHRFVEWHPVLKPYKLPLAYVLQDGEREDFIPWNCIAAVFIGGSTVFKVGESARTFVAAAKVRGKWVHMGRVNTVRRLMYAQQIGCDSVDGSGFARFPDAMLPKFLRVETNGTLPMSLAL